MEHAVMTPEMWTTITVAIALAGLVVGGHLATGRRLERVENRLTKRIDEQGAALTKRIDEQAARIEALHKEMSDEFKAVRKETGDQNRELGERVAHVAGLVDGLYRRDAA